MNPLFRKKCATLELSYSKLVVFSHNHLISYEPVKITSVMLIYNGLIVWENKSFTHQWWGRTHRRN